MASRRPPRKAQPSKPPKSQDPELLERIHQGLVDAVESMQTSDGFKAALRLAQRTNRYSMYNLFLIQMQRPDATYVANWNQWKRLGRTPKKGSGEETIWISKPSRFAPLFAEDDQTPEAERKPMGYKPRTFDLTPVWDISSTEGADLPDIGPKLLTGDGPKDLYDGLVTVLAERGWTMVREFPRTPRANGEADPATCFVRVRPDVSGAQATKTGSHETGHVWRGHTKDLGLYRLHRGEMEIEAESIAYVLAGAYGLDTSAYSVGYLSSWGADPKAAAACASKVIEATREIMTALGFGKELEQTTGTEAAQGTGQVASV